MQNVFYIDISPVIVQFGSFRLDWYPVLIALAVAAAVGWLILENGKTRRLKPATLVIAIVIGLAAGIVFAKLLHVIDYFDLYRQNPGLILSLEGWAAWGMALGIILGIWIYSQFGGRFRFAVVADMLAPGLILAQAVGRIGCTINGCCYGLETTSSLAVIYTHPDSFGPLGIPVLPVTVFEIFFNLIVFGVLFSLRRKLKPEGSLFLVYCALYAAWRLGSDFMRPGNSLIFGLHEAQGIALLVLFISIPLIALKVRRAEKDAAYAVKSISSPNL